MTTAKPIAQIRSAQPSPAVEIVNESTLYFVLSFDLYNSCLFKKSNGPEMLL
jgi:hypothetical protein